MPSQAFLGLAVDFVVFDRSRAVAYGTFRTCRGSLTMSALGGKADIATALAGRKKMAATGAIATRWFV